MKEQSNEHMREYLLGLASLVRDRVARMPSRSEGRRVRGHSPGGDAQFGLDDVAEAAVWEYITAHDLPVTVLSEDHGPRSHGRSPEHLLIVDPIDGTRPAAAGLETACVSVAAARPTARPTLADVEHALLMELKSGAYLYADQDTDGISAGGFPYALPALNPTTDLTRMFWSIEFNGHPARLMTDAYGHLIDASANTGGVFVLSSATYSISRLITGQFDAYVDIGNRLLRDNPDLLPEFQRAGNGRVLHLFPYDIAAAVFLAEKAAVTITDAYGNSLGGTALTDLSVANQRSCVAACTPELHSALLESIRWTPAPAKGREAGDGHRSDTGPHRVP
ncbi:inositol monophosphatase family protein [Streptomyces sp. H27-D2]|uniref:inositol monophosphatase family protein n=1 Tax=Streptomyces sp. H27-D2 TaxID=3046304 RepID=UPI002DB63971|nr:inositol monophosphatase family protein [Streptomyces sp. H27-D2]MEC4019436.1 inositol monophosphatase family protein [Streptomyces sp. H27-D2]